MRITRTVCVLVLTVAGAVMAQAGKLNVAVNDLTPQGAERGEAAVVSDRLRSEMIATGVFRVMERAQMESVLKEQGFQKSGACDDASCIVEVGQLLGVDRMVAGSLGRVAGLYTINLRVINVATGEILYTVNEDCECAIKDVLSGAVARAAGKLARGAGDEVARAAMAGKTGDLYIESDQPGATVEIDGRAVAGETPVTIQDFPAGEHRVVVRKGTYYGSQNITIVPGDLLKVFVPMKQGSGSLKVFSNPAQARVLLDGRDIGATPVKADNIAAGEHGLVIRLKGYFEARKMVTIGVDEVNSVSATLVPAARLKVTCNSNDAVILVNGQPAGRQPVELDVPVGEVEVQIESPEYELFKTTVTFAKSGEYREVDAKLVSRFGALAVSSDPPGARIALNDNLTSFVTPFTLSRLIPGTYAVRVELPGYEPGVESATVTKNATMPLRFTLEHTQAWKDSVAAAAAKTKKARRWARRIVFGALGAACGGIGIAFNASAQEHYDAAAAARADYDAARGDFDKYKKTYASEVSDGDNDAVARNVFYIAGGVFGAAMAISIPF